MLDYNKAVTLDRIRKAKHIDDIAGDGCEYSFGLLCTYVSSVLQRHSNGFAFDCDEFKAALALFDIDIYSNKFGDGQARFDSQIPSVYWYDRSGSQRFKNEITVHGYTRTVVQVKKAKRNRRPFSELSPELQEKIRQRDKRIF